MNLRILCFSLSGLLLLFATCKNKSEAIYPTEAPITESVYAVGVVKSINQYQAYAMANGVIENIFLQEGDSVHIGTPILSITNDVQKLNRANAALSAQFSDLKSNQSQLDDALQYIELQRSKVENDSILWARQNNLWKQNIGSKVELEQRELAFKNSKTAYKSAQLKYKDLKRQLTLASQQSKNTLQIVLNQENDFILKSEIEGIIYRLYKEKGEAISSQTPLALLGELDRFILEMQVDEYDIFKIEKGQKVKVTMDSYKGKVFEAVITSISPIMNEASKSFKVEAMFTHGPSKLYPFVTFEANIIIQSKEKALIIPRNYLLNDSLVIKENGDTVAVKTGLRDYKKVEILSGITNEDAIVKPD